MGGAAEQGAAAIIHQHEIGDIDRQRLAVDQRMLGRDAGGIAELLGGLDAGFGGAHAIAFGHEFRQGRVFAGQFLGQRVIGGDGDEGGAVQSVGPRGVDLEPV